MNTFVFVICLVTIVVTADTIQKIYKARAAKKESDADTDEAMAKLDQLEERIRVLERIVTENKYDLRREINSL
jgi:high-affinity nickel permease